MKKICKCGKLLYSDNTTGFCFKCYSASEIKKITAKKVAQKRRSFNGDQNPNYKNKSKEFECKCGQKFKRTVAPSTLLTQGLPKFCSLKCKYKFSISKTKIINFNGIDYRSSWEVSLAKYFTLNNIKFIYEGKSIETPYGVYLPDFYLPETETFYEVKGYFRDENSKNKFLFAKTKMNIILADKDYLLSLGLIRIKSGLKKNQFVLPEEV